MKASRYIPIAAAILLIVGAAVVQGIWTERWANFPELELFAEQLPKVPEHIGEWSGESAPETDQRILEIAGAVGSLARVYRNDRGETVSLFIVCGRLADIFAHTPDRCYPAAGFETVGEQAKQTIETNGGPAQFRTATFLKAEPGGNQMLRIYWTFNGSGPWVAPDEHRWAFAGQRALYKVYVVTSGSDGDTSDQNAAVDFIRLLMPELSKTFAPALEEGRKASTVTDTTDEAPASPEPSADAAATDKT
jgi:EpsI family protein